MRPGISDSTVERFRAHIAESDAVQERAIGALGAFFGNAPAALLLVDEHLDCVQVNARLAALTGLAIEAHGKRPVRDLLPASLEPRLREVLRTGEPIDKVPLELAERSFLGTFFPVYSHEHAVIGLGGIMIDVTEHKRLESKLRAAIEMRERVLAIVSHDLRNPLGTIQLAMSTMPDTARRDPEAARRIAMVERATKMMETLICDLLDMASIQTGTLSLQLTDESAESIVREAIELHAPLAEEKGQRLVEAAYLGGVHVRCDRARIQQVLSNLLGNAIKFGQRGDTIRVTGHGDERSLILEIEDSGPGIPATDIPHLFEPYWSTARGRQRGTGLGLFISHAIAEAHGGHLTVASTVGVGTTFRFVLPLG